ncbi:type II toxin-antitoxin system RelE/ParE family toxin [Inquilinus sp. KBS0705]|nr:type II toxin-antitoxin system RelE/ParE family toxin [Inquilinus sp. KBS0705]
MAIKVIYLKTAIEDLASIFKYISYDSVKYARLEVQKIKAYCETIKFQPLKGQEFKYVNEKLIRRTVFRNYVIFYFENEAQVNILTIHHHSRSLSNNPGINPED